MLPHFIELNNRVLQRFSAEERAKIGIHTCPGGDRDSVHSADVPYSDLLPSMFGINAGYFLIQLASERDEDRVYQLIGEHLRGDANGVTQMAYVGVINPLNPRVESPEEVRDALVRAANFIPKSSSGRPTTAVSPRSASTRNPATALPTSPATRPSRRSPTGSRGPG